MPKIIRTCRKPVSDLSRRQYYRLLGSSRQEPISNRISSSPPETQVEINYEPFESPAAPVPGPSSSYLPLEGAYDCLLEDAEVRKTECSVSLSKNTADLVYEHHNLSRPGSLLFPTPSKALVCRPSHFQ